MSETTQAHEQVRVGLALSGGGARGLAQLGVLKVLEREGIPVHLAAGTSIGSVMGALYALLGSAEATEEHALRALQADSMRGLDLERILKLSGMSPVRQEGDPVPEEGWLSRTQRLVRRVFASHAALTRPAVIEGNVVLDMFETLFEGKTFDDLVIPFAAVAVDVEEGQPVIIASGSLARAVAASSAIAGIFPPVLIEGRTLIDGGYTSPVPIDAVQALGATS